MATYVLVAGHWLGGEAWDEVASQLRAAGHEVHPVTLTGLGDRTGRAASGINLDTHADDIVRTIEDNDLHDVVLVGHSGGGIPVTQAADRIADEPERRLAKIVYVESGPLLDGMSQSDTLEPEQREARLRQPENGEWTIPVPSWVELGGPGGIFTVGLGEAERARFSAQAVPQPLLPTTNQLRLHHQPAVDAIPHALVTCAFPLEQVREMIDAGSELFIGFPGKQWEYIEVTTGHWPMFSEPERLADALGALAE